MQQKKQITTDLTEGTEKETSQAVKVQMAKVVAEKGLRCDVMNGVGNGYHDMSSCLKENSGLFSE